MQSEVILQVQNLYKSFGQVKAVQGTSFAVQKGQCFGLLGPNGAGKSTTIEMIETIQRPDQGEILFHGKRPGSHYLEKLGVQFQQTSLPHKLTVKETLETFSRLYQNAKPLDELIQLCQLTEFQNQDHEKISGGQRQRLLLAIALCHDPELILLDEPTTGLDPQARRHLWSIVKDIKEQGKTIILTTHYMDEAYELCDEIAIMDKGTIIAQGSPDQLLTEFFKTVIIEMPLQYHDQLENAPANHIYKTNKKIEIHTDNVDDTIKEIIAKGISLQKIHMRQSNLEDLFIELTGKEMRA
jgi:ABC-2 type transport system ATP-binding protein